MADTPELELACSATVYGVPRSHWHCDLANFEWATVRPLSLRAHLAQFQEQVRRGQAPHLILTGEPGHGKSHLGVALYRWAAQWAGTWRVRWIHVPTFCYQVKAGFQPGAVDPFTDYEDCRTLVVLDDLLGREYTQYEQAHVLYRLIDQAYQQGTAMVVTVNYEAPEVVRLLGAHESSRLFANATTIQLHGSDWRRRRTGG